MAEPKEPNAFIKKPMNERLDLSAVMSIIKSVKDHPSNDRIDPNDFRNATTLDDEHVSVNVIKKDLEEVERKKNKIAELSENLDPNQARANLIANFVEIAIPESIKNLGWLGTNVRIINPSLYDDYERGVDSILQMYPNEIIKSRKDLRILGFSIDFTISETQYEKKFFNNGLAIAEGKIPQIRYFSADVMTESGNRNVKIIDLPIPKIIISCPQNELLAEAQEHLFEYSKSPKDEDKKRAAQGTTLKYYFIRESLAQLRCFKDLSEKFENYEAEELYSKALDSFIAILKENGIDDEVLEQKLVDINQPKISLDNPNEKYEFIINYINIQPTVVKKGKLYSK